MVKHAFRPVLLVAAVALGAAVPASASASSRLGIPSALPSYVAHTPDLGRAASNEPVRVLVGLRLRNRAALDNLISRVSDPRSADYTHYISPAQFHARFSPSRSSVAAVERFARLNGMAVTAVPANRLFVEMTGTTAQAERAFATRLDRFRLAGRLVHAPVRTPSVPASLRAIVTGVEGLDAGARVRPMIGAPAAFVNAGPCSTYWGEKTADGTPGVYGDPNPRPYAPCGYTPAQLEGAYGVSSAIAAGNDGKGVTVGIIDAWASQTITDDANTWSQKYGLPPVDLTDVSDPVAGNQPEDPLGAVEDPQGWAGEQTLDVEAVHAMAPGAKIVYDGADSDLNEFMTQAQNDMVDNKRAQIVSNSYGSADDSADANTHAVLQQAAATGIGFYFSSGDEGDETQDPNGPGDRETDSPANDPLQTAVGGTSLAVGQSDDYLFETGWGTSKSTLTGGKWDATPGTWLYGGGGGTSQTYAEPDYQKGVVPDALANWFKGKPGEMSQQDFSGTAPDPIVPGRVVPDVAMDGDPNTGMIEGITQDYTPDATGLGLQPVVQAGDDVHYGEYRIGGTSLASPLFAGVMALADQRLGKPHGFANPALYAAGTAAFRDVDSPAATQAIVRNDYNNGLDASGGVTTSLRTLNQVLTLHVTPGFDDTTGLGSPNGESFLDALAGIAPAAAAGSTMTAADGSGPAAPGVVDAGTSRPSGQAQGMKTTSTKKTTHRNHHRRHHKAKKHHRHHRKAKAKKHHHAKHHHAKRHHTRRHR